MARVIRLVDYVRAFIQTARRESFEIMNALGGARALIAGSNTRAFDAFKVKDIRSADPAKGSNILSGRFVFCGETLDGEADPFAAHAPSEAFARRLHGFEWLRDLLACRDSEAQLHAGELIDMWISGFSTWNSFTWAPELAAHRIINWTLAPSILKQDPNRVKSLARQARHLRRSARHSFEGPDQIRAAIALMLSGAFLDDEGLRQSGIRLLDTLLSSHILTDGGHINRSPQTAAEILTLLTLLDTAEGQANRETPVSILRAMDRMAPFIRFFRFGDGGLSAFHGGGEGDKRAIDHALGARDTGSRTFGYAPNSGYQRVEAGGATIIMDSGKPVSGPQARSAHASSLAFELYTPGGRMVVNCGWSDDQPRTWREAVRATAAHSTLTLEETSSARLLPRGWQRTLLGPRFGNQPGKVVARRNEEDIGTWIEATHDGYANSFGLHHRRRLFLAADGGDLRGEDGLYRPVEEGPPEDVDRRIRYAIRFHLHPDVKASLARDGMSALLVMNNGDGWRFRTDGGPIRIERSVYLAAGGATRRTSQIVISGEAEPFGAGERPPNRVRWAFQRLGRVGGA